MPNIPYEYRILALFVFIGFMLLLDLKNPKDQRLRLKTYGFILLVGILGVLYGICIDSMTSRISPDYFIYGKGVEPGPHFYRDVLMIGMKAGFSGAVVVGVALVVTNPVKKQISPLFRLVGYPLVLSVVTGLLFGILQSLTNIIEVKGVWPLGELRAQRFANVWVIHIGIYLGGLIGLTIACFKNRVRANPAA